MGNPEFSRVKKWDNNKKRNTTKIYIYREREREREGDPRGARKGGHCTGGGLGDHLHPSPFPFTTIKDKTEKEKEKEREMVVRVCGLALLAVEHSKTFILPFF